MNYTEGKSAVYRSSDDFINRQLDMVPTAEKVERRLALDIADILTGPTSGGKAQYLADCLVKNREAKELCERLIECAQRYLKTQEKQEYVLKNGHVFDGGLTCTKCGEMFYGEGNAPLPKCKGKKKTKK